MARTKYFFVAGEQVITAAASSACDAWLAVELKARTRPVASEFRELPIAAFDADGVELATRTWDGWHNEVLRDTYGEDYSGVLTHAAEKMR